MGLLHLRQLCQGGSDLLVGGDIVGHLPVVELLVGVEVKVAGAGEAEEDGFLLAGLLALEGLVMFPRRRPSRSRLSSKRQVLKLRLSSFYLKVSGQTQGIGLRLL